MVSKNTVSILIRVAAKINASIAIPNPVTVGSSIALISEVYENC